MIRLVLSAAAILLTVAVAPPAPRESPRLSLRNCAADSAGAQLLVRNLQKIATGTEYPYPILRDSLHIPAVAATEVAVVADSAFCADAAAVYDSVLAARGDQSNSGRNVIVVRVGDRYAVQDPQETVGEWRVTITLDSAKGYLSIW